MDKKQLEESLSFAPRFDKNGLIPCITADAGSGDVLMFAYMNADALRLTIKTGEAHYWSRSRKSLWHKGATSGFIQHVMEMRTDCDQDCLWIKVEVRSGDKAQAACHTGRKSCFYRKIKTGTGSENPEMEFIDADRLFNPEDIYNQ